MHEIESRTRHLLLHAVPLADRLHERGLPGTHLPGECHEERRVRRTSEAAAPIAQLVFSHRERTVIGERRYEWWMRLFPGGTPAGHRTALTSAATLPRTGALLMRALTSK